MSKRLSLLSASLSWISCQWRWVETVNSSYPQVIDFRLQLLVRIFSFLNPSDLMVKYYNLEPKCKTLKTFLLLYSVLAWHVNVSQTPYITENLSHGFWILVSDIPRSFPYRFKLLQSASDTFPQWCCTLDKSTIMLGKIFGYNTVKKSTSSTSWAGFWQKKSSLMWQDIWKTCKS